MTQTIVIDPVTRIEGHLRIEAETVVNADGSVGVQRASSSSTMVRGIEIIMKGRDPRDAWAFAQRICGVCTVVHGVTSARAVENALGIAIPPNAEMIRNLMMGAQYIHDHVMHFYHLHSFDWVDAASALSAQPLLTSQLQTSISPENPNNSPEYFQSVRDRLYNFANAGQLGIFGKGYWGHPAYRLPAEANLILIAHYFEALAWARKIVKLHAVFGGKDPHPNVIVGGMPCAISSGKAGGVGEIRSGTAVNAASLALVAEVIADMKSFTERIYLPDMVLLARLYNDSVTLQKATDWTGIGEGVGNYLCYGDFPMNGINDLSGLMIPRGIILNRDLSQVYPLDVENPEDIQEFVAHSWYDYSSVSKTSGLHPYAGETKLNYTGPAPGYAKLPTDQSYSWIKSPRWRGKAMEVGPLAHILMMYASGQPNARLLVKVAYEVIGWAPDPTLAKLQSTMGRNVARAMETYLIALEMNTWLARLNANIAAGDLSVFNNAKWNPATWPSHARGFGYSEAPRGALGHWVVIDAGKISNYQCVVASQWNAGPRDAAGVEGPYEAALRGHLIADGDRPLEILRTIHSFDPCIGCAVHVARPDGRSSGWVNDA